MVHAVLDRSNAGIADSFSTEGMNIPFFDLSKAKIRTPYVETTPIRLCVA
jgi:hypothetical protein